MAEPTHQDDANARPQSTTAQISNKIVQLMREYTGRGPTRARTYLNEAVVVCIVQDTLTKGEQALVDGGEVRSVLNLRRQYQSLMEARCQEGD